MAFLKNNIFFICTVRLSIPMMSVNGFVMWHPGVDMELHSCSCTDGFEDITVS